jgi:hypothetical protein
MGRLGISRTSLFALILALVIGALLPLTARADHRESDVTLEAWAVCLAPVIRAAECVAVTLELYDDQGNQVYARTQTFDGSYAFRFTKVPRDHSGIVKIYPRVGGPCEEAVETSPAIPFSKTEHLRPINCSRDLPFTGLPFPW